MNKIGKHILIISGSLAVGYGISELYCKKHITDETQKRLADRNAWYAIGGGLMMGFVGALSFNK